MINEMLKNYDKAKYYQKNADKRKANIIDLMWNDKLNFFFDYNMYKKEQSDFYSVAGFYPLWANLASPEQARLIRDKTLPIFECDGGIVNTQSTGLSDYLKQHDYPNGWPGQQWIVIKGLLNYGFKKDALRIAKKWLDMNAKIFSKTSNFWEKHDVVFCEVGVYNPDRYKTQNGFAWTNAIFVRLINDLF
jgi:alpha,alpha-trehalase